MVAIKANPPGNGSVTVRQQHDAPERTTATARYARFLASRMSVEAESTSWEGDMERWSLSTTACLVGKPYPMRLS
jgi:hypothetical protein